MIGLTHCSAYNWPILLCNSLVWPWIWPRFAAIIMRRLAYMTNSEWSPHLVGPEPRVCYIAHIRWRCLPLLPSWPTKRPIYFNVDRFAVNFVYLTHLLLGEKLTVRHNVRSFLQASTVKYIIYRFSFRISTYCNTDCICAMIERWKWYVSLILGSIRKMAALKLLFS